MTYPVQYKYMTEHQACIIQAKHMGATTKEAKVECAACNNNIKKRYAVSAYGVFEDTDEEPLDQTTTVHCAARGVETEQQFIKAQIKRGDTRAHAEKLAHGIAAWIETRAVKDADGNISEENIVYYTHDSLGKREFHKIEKPKPHEPTPYEICVETLQLFKETKDQAEETAKFVMYASAEHDKTVTPLTLRLRDTFNAKANFDTKLNVASRWILERINLNAALAERERKKKPKLTVGSRYEEPNKGNAAKDPFKDFNDKHLVGKGEQGFPLHNRITVGSPFGKTKEQILRGE